LCRGFGEAGHEGKKEQERLKAIAEKYGMRFVGPNCLGVINTHHRLNMTFLPCEGNPGFIGMASQSGSFITQMFDYLQGLGLGFSTGISVGNEADVDLVDGLTYLAACPHTKVIALYVEAIRRGRAFIDAARRIAPEKPVVAYYVGGPKQAARRGFPTPAPWPVRIASTTACSTRRALSVPAASRRCSTSAGPWAPRPCPGDAA
jgi:acetyl-CoA synthetase (ADP-forming)